VREALTRPLVSEDGEPVRLELLPPLSDSERTAFEGRLPCPLPSEVRELLSVCSGFEGSAVDLVDFTGVRCLFTYEAVFPHGLPIAADGFGNFWVVDLLPTSQGWGPIYFACHDAPVILREPQLGFGFSWGRYGPSTVVRRHESLPLFAYQAPQGLLNRLLGGAAPRQRSSPGAERMPLSDRLVVAAIATAVAIPPVVIALGMLVLIGMSGGLVSLLVWPAFLVLGSIWTYEIVSRVMGGKVGRYAFSVTAVAIGAMVGLLAGILMMVSDMAGFFFEVPILGFLGALVGTCLPAKAPASTGRR
jgi:hypothetical protein